MSFIPDPALVAIEQNKDNPIVQCMLMFIWHTLHRETKEIAEWSTDESSMDGYASFKVTFRDCTGVKGAMANGMNGWVVRGFNLFATISGNSPCVIDYTKGDNTL